MDAIIRYVALFGTVVVAVIFLIELRRWSTLATMLSRKHRALRVWLVVLLEVLFALMIAGPWLTSSKSPLAEALYWSFCLLLGLLAVCVALLDIREVAKQFVAGVRGMAGDLRGGDSHKQ